MESRMRSLAILLLVLAPTVATEANAGGRVVIPFAAANFTHPLDIDNPYWPLVAGTTFVYRTAGDKDCEVNDVEVTSNQDHRRCRDARGA